MLVLLGPLLLGVSALALQQRHLPSLLACMVAACGLWAYVPRTKACIASSTSTCCSMPASTSHSAACSPPRCGPARTPLISAFALRVHRTITPALPRYTRQVTWVWSVYFGAMVALSLALFVAAPWWWWSVFANLVTPVAAMALFVGEYLLRYRLHPEFERITLAQALQAYRDTPLVEARRP